MLDMTASELAGSPFVQTWIYGTLDGDISFFEPMITMAYLQNLKGKECYNLKMPQAFGEPGYYPTRTCNQFNRGQGTYQIILDKFKWLNGD